MEFTLEELKRIYEFANWGVQKKGLTNKDFRSATEKGLRHRNPSSIILWSFTSSKF